MHPHYLGFRGCRGILVFRVEVVADSRNEEGEHRSKAEDGWDSGDEERKGEEDGMPREEERPSPGVDILMQEFSSSSSV